MWHDRPRRCARGPRVPWPCPCPGIRNLRARRWPPTPCSHLDSPVDNRAVSSVVLITGSGTRLEKVQDRAVMLDDRAAEGRGNSRAAPGPNPRRRAPAAEGQEEARRSGRPSNRIDQGHPNESKRSEAAGGDEFTHGRSRMPRTSASVRALPGGDPVQPAAKGWPPRRPRRWRATSGKPATRPQGATKTAARLGHVDPMHGGRGEHGVEGCRQAGPSSFDAARRPHWPAWDRVLGEQAGQGGAGLRPR